MSSQPENITIYSPGGAPIRTVSFDSNAEQVEDLMRADYVQLHWEATDNTEIPAGAYITFGGRKFTLLDPYTPEQADELQHTYTPQFQSRIMEWGKIPYFHYNQAGGSATPERESDWSLTANASTHLASVVAALAAEGQGTWTVEIDDYMQSQGATTISFQATDIFSGLNSIASAFEGEWLARENTSGANGGKIYFARRIVQGTPIALTVGDNVGVPSVTVSKEGYYNRFYVFGSTRNITQDYAGANVNALVNKRLTLDPAKYPGSYIDTRKDTKEPIYSKFLTFDDIYPRAHLKIPSSTLGLRARIMYRIDEATSLPKVIGTNSKGEPVYDQYVVWYFRPVISDTGAEFTILDPTTYDPETNPTGELIKGKTLSVHFSSGLLNGREFELRFVDKNETLKGQSFPGLGLSTPDFATYKGDFEIKYVEEGSMIVPTDISGGVHPQVGDVLTLFNLRMPASYVSSSQKGLEEAAQETIAERYDADLNNYTLPSNQVAFCKNDLGLTVGHAVKYTNGAYSYETRVIRIVRKLDTPNYCEQEITIGSEKIKGDRQTLREDVVDVNRNIEQLAALNSLTETIAQSYARAQQVMLDAIARSADIWKLDEEGNAYTERNVYSLKEITALGNGGSGGDGSGGPGGVSYFWELADVDVSSAVKNDIPVYNGSKWVNMPMASLRPDLSGYATEAWVKAQGYLTQHQSLAGYATQTWVEGKGYALASELAKYLPLTGGTLTGPLTMGGAGVHRIYFKDAEHFIELDEEGNFHFSGNVYADGEITALGYQAGDGGSSGSFSGALADLTDVRLSELTAGDLIQWNGEKFVNVRPSELGISGAVDLSNYVTLNTPQTIEGAKTFATTLIAKEIQITGTASATGSWIRSDSANNIYLQAANKSMFCLDGANNAVRCGSSVAGTISLGRSDIPWNNVYANKFIKVGGTSAQFLKADGSVDGNSYLTGMPIVAPTANFQDYMAGLKGINWRSGDTTLTYGAMRAADAVLDVGNSYARFFRLMHNRKDGNLRFQGSTNVDSASTAAWGTERTLLDTVNYAGLIDSRYVKKAGDTMTGSLIQTLSADAWLSAIVSRSPTMTTGNRIRILLGKSSSTYNAGYLAYGHKGDASTSNYMTIGFWGKDEILNVLANGKVGIGTTSPVCTFDVDGSGRVIGSFRVNAPSTLTSYNQGIRLAGETKDSSWSLLAFGCDPSADSGTHANQWLVGRSANNNFVIDKGGASGANGLIITNALNVGMGTASPEAKLDVIGIIKSGGLSFLGGYVENYGIEARSTNGYGTLGDVTGDYAMYFNFGYGAKRGWIWRRKEASSSTLVMSLSCDGKLYVAGTIYATGEITALSDRRVKSDIRTLPFRGALIPRTYIKDGRPSIGFIAQEVNELYPELVNKGVTPDSLWSLNYQAITAVLAAQLGTHEDELTELCRRVTDLETELKNYRRA